MKQTPLTYLLSHRAHLGREGRGEGGYLFASDVRIIHLFIKRHNLSTFDGILNMKKNQILTCISICIHMKIWYSTPIVSIKRARAFSICFEF